MARFFTGVLACRLATVKKLSAWLETVLVVLLLVNAAATLALLAEELPAAEKAEKVDGADIMLTIDDAAADELLASNGLGSVAMAPM